MMIETSAVLAVLLNEPERAVILDAIEAAANHNTLCFDGADQADFFGSFRCGRRPNVEVLDYQVRDDGFSLTATHDGFRNLSGSPRHVRRFEVAADRIEIEGRGARRRSCLIRSCRGGASCS